MWRSAPAPEILPDDLAINLAQLRRSSLRSVILAGAGLYVLLQLGVAATWPRLFGWPMVPVVVLVLASNALAFVLARRRLLLAQCVWQGGLAAAALLAALAFQRPEPLLFLAFQPFIVTVTLGWRAGAGVWLLLALGVMFLLRQALVVDLTLPYALAILFAGAFGAVLGWAAISNLVMVVAWLADADQQSRRNLEAARQHRSQLLQAVKELDQANYRMVRINAALAAARHTAEEALRFKAEFVANVSHELRTPLNLIIGFSEVMTLSPESYGGQPLPGPYRADINAIYNNAKHLAALVDDVLDLGRIEADKLTFSRTPVSVASLIEEVAGIVEDYIAAKGLHYAQHLAPELPVLLIDRTRIRQVLLNLLVNAVRFTDAGVIKLEITRDGDEIRFAVADSGRGISAAELPVIFEPFHTSGADNGAQWFEGKGLGLPISKKYVEMHGGAIGVESTPGQGSTFWFTLPVSRAALAKPAAPVMVWGDDAPPATEPLLVGYLRTPALLPLLQRDLAGYRLEPVTTPAQAAVMAHDLGASAILTDDAGLLHAADPAPPAHRVPVIVFPGVKPVAPAWEAHVDAVLTRPVAASAVLALYDRVPVTGRRVLIADANPDIVRLLRRILRARLPASDLLEAYNGEEALQRLRDDAPALAFIDIGLRTAAGEVVVTQLASPPTGRVRCVVALTDAPTPAAITAHNRVTVHCPAELTVGQTTRLVHAVCGALAPVTATAPALRAAPPG